MNRAMLPLWILAAALLVSIVQIADAYPRLPATLASHFDASGRADGWMSKSAFLMVFGFATLLASGLPVSIGLVAPRLPDALVNVPHKAYWLAPQRREETLACFSRHLLWIAAATALLLTILLRITIDANLRTAPEEARLGSAWIFTLVIYFAWLATSTIGLIRRFAKPHPTLD